MEWEKIHRSLDNIKVVGYIYLWQYEHDFDALYWRLKELYQENYAPNQKIVIIHDDTDYYYHRNPTGFYIHNLMSVLSHVDISPGVLIFLTSHVGLEDGLEPFITNDNDRPLVIHSFLSFIASANIELMEFRHCSRDKNIEKNAMCLLGSARSHRVLLYQLMSMFECFDGVDVNLSNPAVAVNFDKITAKKRINKFIDAESSPIKNQGIVYLIPHQLNDSWTKHLKLPELIQASGITVPNHLVQPKMQGKITNFYNNYGVDIVVETTFDCPYPHINEKIMRPLFMCTPFVVVGASGYLKFLHSYGFKTFGDIWNEGYDSIVDPQQRLLACARLIKEISSWPLQKIKDINAQLQDRLTYNRENFLHYIDNVREPVYNKLIANSGVNLYDTNTRPNS